MSSSETHALISRLRAFCFPEGENAARCVRSLKTNQQGEIRATPGARWMPFTAEEFIDATQSHFRWEARFGEVTFIDAYEEDHGLCAVKPAGASPMQKMAGPEFDHGELQLYLASIPLCPSILLHHPSLEWAAAGALTLQVRDHADPTGATIDLDINGEGRPLACRADRPRMAGKETVRTPWSGAYAAFRQWEGTQVASRIEVSWRLPTGEFPYFWGELTSLERVR
jgi:hypothetical protein